jgi:hypothetical protein
MGLEHLTLSISVATSRQMAGDLPPKALISRQTNESSAKPFLATNISKMSPILVVSAFFLGQSENLGRKCEDLVSNKFHDPIIVFSAEAS